MHLVKLNQMQLYVVSESPNGKGVYTLEPFTADLFFTGRPYSEDVTVDILGTVYPFTNITKLSPEFHMKLYNWDAEVWNGFEAREKIIDSLRSVIADVFNEPFREDRLYQKLDALTDCMYSKGYFVGGRYCEHRLNDDCERDDKGNFVIRVDKHPVLSRDSEEVIVPDIIGKIDTDPADSLYFVVGNYQLTEYLWIVAKRCMGDSV